MTLTTSHSGTHRCRTPVGVTSRRLKYELLLPSFMEGIENCRGTWISNILYILCFTVL